MIKQSAKNSLNHSFLTSFNHQNKQHKDIFSQTHNNHKKRTQSFMIQNNQYEKLTKQLSTYQKHNNSFHKSFTTKNIDKQSQSHHSKKQSINNSRKSSINNSIKQSINQSRKSSSKHKKQRTSFSIISQQRQKVKGGIRKNNINPNLSYQSNNDHLKSFDSNIEKNKIRRKQNRSLTVKNIQQNQNHRKQDNIQTDFQQRSQKIQFKKKKTLHQDQQVNQNIYQQQQQILCKENVNPNINLEEIQKLDDMTSKRISQLQSRCQTIDLLRFTIKTKLSNKDNPNYSQHFLNSLMSSDNKSSQRQYIQEILKLKDLQTNFYIDKITSLQNQLNKTRKQTKFIEQQILIKCNQDNRKNLIEKIRFQSENQLLKRENQALRTIILKKIKNRSSF